MKSLSTILALAVICAASVVLTAKTVPTKKFHAAELQKTLKTEPFEISIDELALPISSEKEFQESLIPKEIAALNGKRVRMIGQMWRRIGDAPVANFMFNGYSQRDTDPLEEWTVQHFITVSMRKGTKTAATQQAIEIEGRLVIRPIKFSGIVIYLYHVEDAIVRPSERPKGFRLPAWIIPIFTC